MAISRKWMFEEITKKLSVPAHFMSPFSTPTLPISHVERKTFLFCCKLKELRIKCRKSCDFKMINGWWEKLESTWSFRFSRRGKRAHRMRVGIVWWCCHSHFYFIFQAWRKSGRCDEARRAEAWNSSRDSLANICLFHTKQPEKSPNLLRVCRGNFFIYWQKQ